MKMLITGGTGFVGTQLTSRLIKDNHEVTILSRSAKPSGEVPQGIFYLQGDPNALPCREEARPGDVRYVFAIVQDGAALRPVARVRGGVVVGQVGREAAEGVVLGEGGIASTG